MTIANDLLLTPGYMPWGGAGGQNIEHPHTLAILSSFFLLQMHFSFIGQEQFRRAMLFCNSSYYYGPRQANLVLIHVAYASSDGSGEPAHPRSLARTFAARSYKQQPSDRKPDPWPF